MKYYSIIAIFFALFWPLMVSAQNHVGIIVSGYEENCEINHLGKVYQCEKRRELFIGDMVTKKPTVKNLKIKWAPYVRGTEREQIYLDVVASKPDTLKGSSLTSAVKRYVDDFVKPPTYGTMTAATRGSESFPPIITLLHDYPLKIEKAEDDRSIVIADSQGKKVWETLVKGREELFLSAKQIPMNPNETYTLTMESDVEKSVSTVSLMDQTLQDEARKSFKDMDKHKASPVDAIIEKVAYCQLVSDVYPDKVDLYWLGNQFLKKNTLKPSVDQNEIIKGLEFKYANHIRKTK